jgi:beta-lactamase regulating signal transducer with metallopeptidase domain
MNYLQLFSEWSTWMWRIALNHLWQGTIFFLIAILASLLLRGGSARARYLLWVAASIKFAVPSAIIIFTLGAVGINLQSAVNSSPQSTKTLQYITPVVSPLVIPSSYLIASKPEQTTERSTKETAFNIGQALGLTGCVVWLLGTSSFLWIWLKRRRQIALVIKSGRVVNEGREWETLVRVKSWLGITRRVDLIVTADVKEPGVWRVFVPIVLLSEAISSQLSDEELEALMMHEMGHVLRWDNLVSNVNMILCCIFWFNPIIWLIDNWLLKEREEACDEMVLRWSGTGEIYASSIKKIYRFCLISRVSGLSAAAGSNLKHRLERIIVNSNHTRFSPAQRVLVSTVILGSVILTVIAAMQPADRVLTKTNTVLIEATQGFKQQVATQKAPDCAEAELRKCLHAPTTPITAEQRLAEVVIDDRSAPLQTGSATIAHLDEPATVSQPNVTVKSNSDQASNFQSAHAVNLERFAGRYSVDPSIRENFVLDVNAEDGQLWLKPSYAGKHRLIVESSVDYVDSVSPNTRITFTLDEGGNVESLTLRGWGPTIVAPRLVLPAPSREGNMVFRLSDFSGAKIVAVAGTFNGWNQSQYLFEHVGNEWICKINLPPGKYQYKFIVDGNWLVDPSNPTVVHDRRGFENSELIVR